MPLTHEQVAELIKAVSLTRLNEIACDECLKDLAEFAEFALAGKSVPEGLQAVENHLAICAECQEEFKALLAALSQSE